MPSHFNDEVAVLGTVDPDAMAAGTAYTDAIDMDLWSEVAFTVLVGELGASATVDFALEAATDQAMTSPVTIRSITQLTEAGSDDDKQAVITVRAAELAKNGYRYVRGKLTVAVAACDVAVLAQGFAPSYKPASDNDLASVDEIKTSGS